MKRTWIVIVAVAALALPGTALAHNSESGEGTHKNASKLCKSLKGEMGLAAFRTAYGENENGRNAPGKCVSRHRHLVKRLIAKAISECKAEREASMSMGPDHERGERGDHGTSEQRSAFRECVKAKVVAMLAELRAAFDAAVEQCKTERAADVAAFQEKYGKGKHNRHAVRVCVYQHVRESSSTL